jgi:hypothetical protein
VSVFRHVRDGLRRFEVVLFWVALVLGIYLAVANLLRGARYPNEDIWQPWKPLFVAMVVAALFVPLYAFYKAIDAYLLSEEGKQTKLRADLDLLCQRVVADLCERCPMVSANDLSAQVWLCRDEQFDRLAEFMLPEARQRSGVAWGKGKGIAGLAWTEGEEVSADLSRLKEQLNALGDADFDRLPAEERYGMTAGEVHKTEHYAGVFAVPLFSRERQQEILGVLVVDYMGREGFACIVESCRRRPVTIHAGACEKVLTEGRATLGV